MTTRRQPDGLIFRLATEADIAKAAEFCCSRGAPHEDEVQHFVQTSVVVRAFEPGVDYETLVFIEDERLVAVGSYHRELLLTPEDEGGHIYRGREAIRLHVLALSLQDQGRATARGRISDLVLQTLITEAMNKRDEALLTAIIHRDNVRSFALCARHGLTSQVEYDYQHIRASGWFTLRSSD